MLRRYNAKLNLISNFNDVMVDAEKIRICSLDDRSDYGLWGIQIGSAIEAKEYGDALIDDKSTTCSDDVRRHASHVIVSTLSIQALRVVHSVIKNPMTMLTKLVVVYESETVSSRISKILKLVGT